MFAGVGERTREGNDLYKEMIESVRCISCSTYDLISLQLGKGEAC